MDERWLNGLGAPSCRADFRDETSFEADVLDALDKVGQLMAWHHEGSWPCMETLRDTQLLRILWETEEAPWQTWT